MEFSLQKFFGKGSGSEIQFGKRKHNEESFEKIWSLGSLQYFRYMLCKLGFVTSPIILSQPGVRDKKKCILEARKI